MPDRLHEIIAEVVGDGTQAVEEARRGERFVEYRGFGDGSGCSLIQRNRHSTVHLRPIPESRQVLIRLVDGARPGTRDLSGTIVNLLRRAGTHRPLPGKIQELQIVLRLDANQPWFAGLTIDGAITLEDLGDANWNI